MARAATNDQPHAQQRRYARRITVLVGKVTFDLKPAGHIDEVVLRAHAVGARAAG